jgi:hypothetical protein
MYIESIYYVKFQINNLPICDLALGFEFMQQI